MFKCKYIDENLYAEIHNSCLCIKFDIVFKISLSVLFILIFITSQYQNFTKGKYREIT